MSNIKLDIDSSDLSKNLKIDLLKKNRDAVNIGSEWVIEITPQKKMFNFFGSKKTINTKLNVAIMDLEISPKLKINPDATLLTIIRDGEPYNMAIGKRTQGSVTFDISSQAEAFTVLFHPEAIEDVNETQGSSGSPIYPIRFSIELTDAEGTLIKRCDIQLGIEIEHLVTKPRVEIKIDPSYRDLTYRASLGMERIGSIHVANDSELAFNPSVDVDFKLSITDDNGNHRDLPIYIDYRRASMPDLIERGHNSYHFKVKRLQRGFEVALPVLMDYAKIGNPVREPEGVLSASLKPEVTYNNSNEPSALEGLHISSPGLTLRKNAEQPILNVVVKDPRSNTEENVSPEGLTDNHSVRLEMSPMRFLPSQGMQFPIDIILSNPASENRNAGVYINAPQYSVKFSSGTTVKYRNPAVDNLNNLFTLQGAGDEELMNGSNTKETWRLMFHSGRISDLYKGSGVDRDYNVKAIVKVAFDYYIDDMGIAVMDDRSSLTNPKKMEMIFVIPLYRQPNPTWLAIDFGTSAIVGKYGKNLLDLHKEKSKLDTQEDEYEKGTPFLSSNLVFRRVGEDKVVGRSQLLSQKESVTDFNLLAVHLSPTSTSEKGNIDNVIPCLKLIVGYDLVPNLHNYANYTYNYTDENLGETVRKGMTEMVTTEDGETFDSPTPLAKVDTVFSEVYAQLFKYYMAPVIKEQARGINQLVLTIPNTYTPLHLQRINEIVRNALSDINVRNIRFVSESDAVACYYQNNWTTINQKIGRISPTKLMLIKQKENVLVYDMGAGTLDVTLFQKVLRKDGTIDVRVLGKIGIAKAGNYLDSLIADLLTKYFPDMLPFSDPEMITEAGRVRSAIMLKNFIKNEIKPRLSDEDPNFEFIDQREIGIRNSKDKTEPARLGLKSLTKLILDQEEFKLYVKEVTSEFLDNFFQFFRINDIKIDTVLLSGRSAKLRAIQTALVDALAKYSHEDTRHIDVGALTEDGSAFDKAKTIVAEGAEIYAQLFADQEASVKFHSPNLVAAYGVLYKDIHGEECYTELLNPLDTPSYKTVIVEGSEIKLYKTEEKTVDLSGASTIKLIQTFSAKTLQDWMSGNQEYITVMRELDVSGLNRKSKTRLSIEVDEKNQMAFLVNGMQLSGISSSQIDINSRSNKRSLWPVLKQKN